MEANVERLLKRVSLFFVSVATLSLLYLFFHSSLSCSSPSAATSAVAHYNHQPSVGVASDAVGHHFAPFPRSSCDASYREILPPDKRFAKLRASRAWRHRVEAFAALFDPLRHPPLRLLSNASNVLCVSAGAGHEAAALQESGIQDVTAVDVIDFPPLVSRADPHNLPFFDRIFDLGFSSGLPAALFPARFASEIERTVRPSGAVVLTVESRLAAKEEDVGKIVALFKNSTLLEVKDSNFDGSQIKLIVMKKKGNRESDQKERSLLDFDYFLGI